MMIDKFSLAALCLEMRSSQRDFDRQRIKCFDAAMDAEEFQKYMEMAKYKNDLEVQMDETITNCLAMEMAELSLTNAANVIMTFIGAWSQSLDMQEFCELISLLENKFSNTKKEMEVKSA